MFSYLSQTLETESIRNTVPYSIYLFYFIHFFPNKQKFTCHFYLKADYWWLLKGWISTVFRTQSMLGNTWQMLALNTSDKTSILSIILQIHKLRPLDDFNIITN